MEYVMNSIEQRLYDVIADEGLEAPIQYTIRALVEYAHEMSDLGLKERAHEAMAKADLLKSVLDTKKD